MDYNWTAPERCEIGWRKRAGSKITLVVGDTYRYAIEYIDGSSATLWELDGETRRIIYARSITPYEGFDALISELKVLAIECLGGCMNGLDMLKVQLAGQGFSFRTKLSECEPGWVATKFMLADHPCEDFCLQIEATSYCCGGGARGLADGSEGYEDVEELVVARLSGPIPGVSKSHRVFIEIRDYTPEELMRDLPNVLKALTAGYAALVHT